MSSGQGGRQDHHRAPFGAHRGRGGSALLRTAQSRHGQHVSGCEREPGRHGVRALHAAVHQARLLGGQVVEKAAEGAGLESCQVGRSAYGVLARACTEPADTILWLEASVEARFDGAVEPFCFPDELFGPDLVFFMRDASDFLNFVPVLSQAKFTRNMKSQPAAMLTTVPELLYMDNRGDPNASHKKREKSKINVPSRRVVGPLFDRWESIRHRVFSSNDSADRVGGKRKRQARAVRFLVQYAKSTATAAAGLVHQDAELGVVRTTRGCTNWHDVQVTVDEAGLASFFGSDKKDLLDQLNSL